MWRYNNVKFIYSNDVAGVFNEIVVIPYILTYTKSKFALMEALRIHVESSFLGPYGEFNPRTVNYEKPYKV